MKGAFTEEPTQQAAYRSICRIAANPIVETLLAIRPRDEVNEFVTLKRIRSPHRENPALVVRLLGEARSATRLRHDNVLEILDVVLAGMSVVTEYLPANSLQLMIRRGVPLPITCAIGTSIAAALTHAHRGVGLAPLPHQALSPTSVILTDFGAIKLDDFATMRVVVSHPDAGELAEQVLRYAAPEVCLEERPEPAADLYSLGAILHEAITGLPFEPSSGCRR